MASTEVTVSAAVVSEIQSIALTKLGFKQVNGNVKDYALDFEREANRASYLMADTDEGRAIRCWSVDVENTEEDPDNVKGQSIRKYRIEVTGYYGLGVNGTGVKKIREHSRKIFEVLNAQSFWTMNDTVDAIRETEVTETEVIESGVLQGEDGTMLRKQIIITTEKLGATY
jgi:hypothetical protein